MLLARWVGLVLRWPKSTALCVLSTALFAGYYAAGHLGVNTDTANMISGALPWRQNFNEYRDAFPVRDRNLLIVIDAPSAARADAFAAALLAGLRSRPDLYHAILLQGEGEFFERNGLLYLPIAELEELVDRLDGRQQAAARHLAQLDLAWLSFADQPARPLAALNLGMHRRISIMFGGSSANAARI
jgi:hypothetical protein